MSDVVGTPSLHDRFTSLRCEDVARYVADGRWEDLQLDFKMSESNFSKPEDRKVLARAVSGFANSAGGLIVWGVETKAATPDDAIVASALRPLADPRLFMSRLQEYSGAAATPVVDGVEHRLVSDNKSIGAFAVTIVPESVAGPHMAKLGEDRYYKRTGDRFAKMEHFDIADMFGRRARPDLQVWAARRGQFEVVVRVVNRGRGAAMAPFVGLKYPGPWGLSQWGLDGAGSFGIPVLPGSNENAPRFAGDASVVVHPNVSIDVAIIKWKGDTLLGTGSLVISYEVAAIGQMLTEGQLTV